MEIDNSPSPIKIDSIIDSASMEDFNLPDTVQLPTSSEEIQSDINSYEIESNPLIGEIQPLNSKDNNRDLKQWISYIEQNSTASKGNRYRVFFWEVYQYYA